MISVVEAAKLTRTALAFVATASGLDAVVADETAAYEETDWLAAAGVTVRKV